MDTFQFNAYELPTLEELDPSVYTGVPSNQITSRVVEKKKRKLDLVKCERCRLDRQKCNPVTRVWPTKCDRCISRGFPCSEGKRAERKTKHAALLSKTPRTSMSPEILDNEEDFKNNLEMWSIAFSCAKIVEKALVELSTLKNASIKPFMDKWVEENEHRYNNAFRITRAEELESIPGELARYMKVSQQEMLENRSVSRESWLLAISTITDQSLLNLSNENDTHVQDYPRNEYLQTLKCRGDIGSQFLFRQRILEMVFQNGENGRSNLTYVEGKKEIDKLHILRERLLEEANAILGDLDMRLDGLYNPPGITRNMMSKSTSNLLDCLGRTPILQWLDSICKLDSIHADTMSSYLNRKIINSLDILSRSLLHVACQRGWEEGVEMLLRKGASTHYATIWGHTPLHYAAAIGSSTICQMLIDYEESFSMTNEEPLPGNAKDCQGNTALYYAVGSKDFATVNVLVTSDIYKNSHVEHWPACPPPLIRAILDDEPEIARLIVMYGFDPTVKFRNRTVNTYIESRRKKSKDPRKWDDLKEQIDCNYFVEAASEDFSSE